MDIYRAAKRRGKYPPLFTDTEVNNCFSIQLFRERLSEKSTKLQKPIPKDSMGRRIELLHVLNTNEI